MQSKLNPYISFKNNAREAMEFYQTIFGGKLELHTFAEYHAAPTPSEDDKIMHAMLQADNGITFMAADTPSSMDYDAGTNISLSLSGDNDAELTGYFQKLADGGQTRMPLEQAQWGDKFGMCTDKFGVQWMVNIEGKKV